MVVFDDTHGYLVWAALFQLLMDDIDGWLARRMGVASLFGRSMDDICDVVAHTTALLLMAQDFGNMVWAAAMINAATMVIRTARRLSTPHQLRWGQTTNDSVALMLVAWISVEHGTSQPAAALSILLVLHVFAMLAPFQTRTPRALLTHPLPIMGYHLALLSVYLIPDAGFPAFIVLAAWQAAAFAIGYLSWRRL